MFAALGAEQELLKLGGGAIISFTDSQKIQT